MVRFKFILKSLFSHSTDVQPGMIQHLGIKMLWRKCIRTIDSFFASNRSQINLIREKKYIRRTVC